MSIRYYNGMQLNLKEDAVNKLTDLKYLNLVAAKYNLTFCSLHGDTQISGSPQRSLQRTVGKSNTGEKFIVEELEETQIEKKRIIGKYQHILWQQKVLHIHPPLHNNDHSLTTELGERFFQITPYIPGAALPRPEYVMDAWRGESLADFLISLYRCPVRLRGKQANKGTAFSIVDYVKKVHRDIQTYNPEISNRIDPVYCHLDKNLMKNHHRVPEIFCHGDFHVMNVIWGESGINGVIDWEFCGPRPDVYDIANMIGCVGVEDPNALAGPMVTGFLEKLTRSGLISDAGWKNLAEFIIAIRFAWLAEWLRNGDKEMIELELTYMKLLTDNQAVLFR